MPKRPTIEVAPNRLPKRGRSELRHSVIRVKLGTVLTQAGKKLEQELQNAVKALNRCVWYAWLVANNHLLACLDSGSELPELNQTFFYRCLCVSSDLHGQPTPPQQDGKETIKGLDASASRLKHACADDYLQIERSFRTSLLQNASRQMASDAQVGAVLAEIERSLPSHMQPGPLPSSHALSFPDSSTACRSGSNSDTDQILRTGQYSGCFSRALQALHPQQMGL